MTLAGRTKRADRGTLASAFTLVELLVTIAIVGILASLLLGVAAVAAEGGREAKTKALVSRLHTLLMEQYDGYRDKRVEVGFEVTQSNVEGALGLPTNFLASLRQGELRALARLAAAREQMKMEMPDRWSDFVLEPIDSGNGTPVNPEDVNTTPSFLAAYPSLAELYRLRYAAIWGATNSITGESNTAAQITANQGAECLYMVIVYATGDGEARGLFKESDVGDTDGDGALEFLDGWGQPIQFLRWAPGLDSPLQLSPARLDEIVRDAGDGADPLAVMTAAITGDRDPQDLFRMDDPFDQNNPFARDQDAIRGYRLVPLIYSAGRDEELGLRADSLFVNATSDPWYFDTDTGAEGDNFLGEKLDDTQTDNITNHLIKAE